MDDHGRQFGVPALSPVDEVSFGTKTVAGSNPVTPTSTTPRVRVTIVATEVAQTGHVL